MKIVTWHADGPAPADLPDAGVYVAVFRLCARFTGRIGRLGRIDLPPGVCLYVGSAQRHLPHRLARHARKRKARHWHIDWLAGRAEMVGAVVLEGPKLMECRLARALAAHLPRPVADFGSTDCHCGGHLFRGPVPPTLVSS